MVDLAACDSHSSRSTGGASDAAEYAGEAKRRNPGTKTGGNVLWVMYCIYRQTKNRKITDPHVRLGDISDLTSNNPEVLQRCKVLRVLTLESGKYGRYAVSVMKLIELIQKKEKQVEVVHVGEPQFILTYEDPAGKSERMSWLKTAFVCLVTFFGTMFSIMTFNTDVDIPKLFERISSQFTSDPRGLAILEVTYSVGIGIGVVFFFNHFGKWKITEDPTPMEVEMRAYEEQVDQTILEMESRKENNSG